MGNQINLQRDAFISLFFRRLWRKMGKNVFDLFVLSEMKKEEENIHRLFDFCFWLGEVESKLLMDGAESQQWQEKHFSRWK